MSEKQEEPRTEVYGFTTAAMEHLLGNGEGIEEKDRVPIDVDGENPEVSRLIIELMSACPQPHWEAIVDVPEGADVNTKMYATVHMSEPMWALCKKLLSKHGLDKKA
jgi:hypothetical protein